MQLQENTESRRGNRRSPRLAAGAIEMAELEKAFATYVSSHEALTKKALGLSSKQLLTTQVVEGTAESQVRELGGSVTLQADRQSVERALALSQSFRWANGMVIVPTALSLLENGMFGVIDSEGRFDGAWYEAGVQVLSSNLGTVLGALRLIGLCGWVELQGRGCTTRYRLTDTGKVAASILEGNRPTLARLRESIRVSVRDYEFVRKDSEDAQARCAQLEELLELSRNEWGIPQDSRSAIARRTRRHVVEYLDGVLLGPVMVAFGMPYYTRVDGQLVESGPSLFSLLAAEDGFSPQSQVPLNVDYYQTCLRVLENWELVSVNVGGQAKLSTPGRRHAKVAPPLLALPASYYPSYARMESLLFGNPDPLNVDSDGHVDRLVNIFGSSGAGSGPASAVICDKILRPVFDVNSKKAEAAPLGIADIGCGDGTALLKLAEFVIKETPVGARISHDNPFYVIGADFNEPSLERTRATLAQLSEVPGVVTKVVRADVTDPLGYDMVIRGLELPNPNGSGIVGLGDLIHTFMFLIHNRRLQVSSVEEARAMLKDAVEATDPIALEAAISAAHGKPVPLPQDADALLDLVIEQFKTPYANKGPYVDGAIAAADFVQFLKRWAPYAQHGLVALEGHSPWEEKMIEGVPDNDADFMKCEKLPHAFNWGMHFLSGQTLLPYEEYRIAMALAGYEADGSGVHGGLLPAALGNVDMLDDYRFLSIGRYCPKR